MNIISCSKLAFDYDGKIVVSNLNFEVAAGDYLCVVGENGSGKSTLIKGLLGLKAPAGGTIDIDKELTRSGIGYLPQQSDLQKDFPVGVFELVLSGCIKRLGRRPFFNKEHKRRAEECLGLLGISQLRKANYGELSGGQQQRVLLARAVAAGERMLILDEPGQALDPLVSRELYELVAQLNRERDITIIMVTHDTATAVKYGKHILQLSGEQLFFGTTADYIQSAVGQTYLGLNKGAAL